MSYPEGVRTRAVTIGTSSGLLDGEQHRLSVTFRAVLTPADDMLIWNANGQPLPADPKTVTGVIGAEVMHLLPVTDQLGFRSQKLDALIDVSAADSYSHQYIADVTILSGLRTIKNYSVGPFTLPTGDGTPVDLDLMVPTSTVAGDEVFIPDTWTAIVPQAQTAADEAVAAQVAAQTSATSAANSATAAQSSEASAAGSATAAATSSTAAAGSATSAAVSATSADQSETAALAAQQAAETARDQTNALALTATASTLAPGSTATAEVSGTLPDLVLNFGIPQGDASTVPGPSAYSVAVSNGFVGTESGWLQSLVGPQGDPGDTGPKGDSGDTGPKGDTGPANSLTVGTVTTLAVGASATASVTGTAPEQTLNLGIPRGADGNPTSFELRGTGMPNGVVTASPGTYYTDDAGTCGAWRWIKTSGTGKTGWVVVYGDTGWRSLTLNVAPWNGGASVKVRRIGTDVLLEPHAPVDYGVWRLGSIGASAIGIQPALSLPTEMRPSSRVTLQILSGLDASAGTEVGAILVDDHGQLKISHVANHNGMTFALRWATAAPWPTTLPGTPA